MSSAGPPHRLSFVLSSLRLSGGVRVIVEYANRLSERGYQISLVTPGGTIEPDIRAELVSQVKIYESKVRLGSKSTINKVALAWSLSRAVPPSDIIFSTHTPTIPSAWLAARLWRKSRLFWLYQDYQEMFQERPSEQKILRWGAKRHDKILTVSHWSRAELRQLGATEPVVVGEGLSHAEEFYPRPELRNTSSTKKILCLGDMRRRKGFEDFLVAADILYRRHPNLEFWLVSKEDCNIKTAIPFRYIYRPSRRQLAELYAACDLFVLASWWESFGLPPLEAMACSAAVVLTDSRGVREYARPEENCLLVPPRQPELLAAAIERVLTDPELADRLRRNGPPTAAQFTWAAAVDRFEAAIMK